MFRRNFLFGKDSDTANVIDIGNDDLYRPDKGYGFVIEQNRREQDALKIPELNSAFDTMYWYKDQNITFIREDENGCYIDSGQIVAGLEEQSGEKMPGCPRRIPLIFKVNVPRQGNYKLTIKISSEDAMGEVLIFTGRRRLGFHGNVGAGEFTYTMTTNVCDIVPSGQTHIFADTTVDLAILADKPRITGLTVEEMNCPTVYLAGDSTVTDQPGDYPYYPGTCYCGWGQMLSAFLNTRLAVSNHAHSGLTTDTFRKEGHYAVIEQYSRPGDYIFFQFGHNDQKLPELQAKGGYQASLSRYIKEAQAKGAYPVLVTPIARNTWRLRDQTYLDLLSEFADVCLELGKKYNIPVLDLHKHSMEYVMEKGLQDAKPIFFPGDYTHTNDFGAYQMAGYVAEEIRRTCTNHSERAYRMLAECVTDGFGDWIPTEENIVPKKPRLYKDIPDPQGNQVLLSEAEQLERVVRLCLKEELL